MLLDTQGIVLRQTKYSDHSLIVKIYTEARGTVSFLVKNAYNKKSPMRASLFSPLALVIITYNDLPNKNLHYLKELSRLDTADSMQFDPAKMAILMFYNELLYKLLNDAGEDRLLFHFLKDELAKITDERTVLADLPLRFLLRLSVVLGFFPDNNYTEKNCYFSLIESRFQSFFLNNNVDVPQAESQYLAQLLSNQEPFPVTRTTRNHLLHYLIEYYKIHNEQIKTIESIEILSGLLH